MTNLVPNRENPDEPVLRLSVVGPTLNSLALLVELADHIACDGETPVDIGTYPDEISIDMVARHAWIPAVDWEAEEADDAE